MPYDTIPGSTDPAVLDGGVYSQLPSDPAVLIDGVAAGAAEAASLSAAAAEAALAEFELLYLGPYAADPVLNNAGGPLAAGMLYFNTTLSELRQYTGSAWVASLTTAAVTSFMGRTGAISLLAADINTALSASTLLITDGIETLPGLAFGTDLNTGFYRVGENQIGISAGGGRTALVTVDGFQLKLGTAALPSYSFTGDSNTGMYSSAPNVIDWSVDATRMLSLSLIGLGIGGPAEAGLSLVNTDNGGIWIRQASANQSGFIHFRDSDGTAGGYVSYDHSNNLLRIATADAYRLYLNGAGEFGLNCAPVSSVLARFQNAGNNDVGIELQRLSATLATILVYDRNLGAYRSLALDGSTLALNIAGSAALTVDANKKSNFSGGAFTTTHSQAFTTDPIFNANLANVFEFSGVVTANIASCTINNPSNGQTISIRLKQNATGGFTFTAPPGAKIAGTFNPAADAASILTMTYSAMDSRWEGSWLNIPV